MRIVWYIIGLLILASCGKSGTGFVVKGKIAGYPGTKLFVREIIPENDAWMNDTIEVVRGEFVYRGKVGCPRLVYFIPEDFRGRYELFLENAEIKLNVDDGHYNQMEVSGSRTHEEFTTVKQQAADLIRVFGRYEERKNQAAKENPVIYQQLVDSADIWAGRLLDFLKQQPDYPESMVLPYFASEWIKTEDIRSMESYLEGLTGQARTSVYAQYCERALQQGKRVLPGNPAYDFTLQDTSGKVYQLSDFRGNYVLLEFSASWCGWCKLEIPYLKQVHELTKQKNWMMFTVNLDKERKLWVEEVVREKLPWPVISDLKAFDSPVARQYNIRGIPVIYLIDPDGKIVTNRLRGDGMIEYITGLEI